MAIEKKESLVQARITPLYKLKIKKYADKKRISEGEVIRLSLEKFLHNINAK